MDEHYRLLTDQGQICVWSVNLVTRYERAGGLGLIQPQIKLSLVWAAGVVVQELTRASCVYVQFEMTRATCVYVRYELTRASCVYVQFEMTRAICVYVQFEMTRATCVYV
ncbi:hypothetical protein RRG08_011860 [Elysia crispata]|uniref:Uncharacterized protein n=1 Tax=Elysia crispata TaxID=231223 RepID=A0AAE1DIN9_9GAST|nr:hypothetical protein RRG08_011860 [Elysia crispata]